MLFGKCSNNGITITEWINVSVAHNARKIDTHTKIIFFHVVPSAGRADSRNRIQLKRFINVEIVDAQIPRPSVKVAKLHILNFVFTGFASSNNKVTIYRAQI